MFLLKAAGILTSTGWLTVLLATILVFILLRSLLTRSRNLPPGPVGLPILGYLPFLFTDQIKLLRDLTKKYGDVVSFDVLGIKIVHLGSYDVIRNAFVTHGTEFADRPDMSLMKLVYPRNLGVAFGFGEGWKEHRRFILHTLRDFGFGKLSMEARIHEVAEDIVKALQETNERPADVMELLYNSSANIICSVVFDHHFKMDDPTFLRLMGSIKIMLQADILQFFFSGPLFSKLPLQYLPGFKTTIKSHQEFFSVMSTFIKEHEKTFDPNFLRDYVDVYLNEKIKHEESDRGNKNTFTSDRLLANATDLLLAGTETTSNTIHWALQLLLFRPELQKKIHSEIDEVIGRERLPSNKDRLKMPYTEAVINEVMRFSSLVALSVFHSNPVEVKIQNYTIPKNSVIIPNILGAHYDPKIWTDPEKFDPSRFLDSNGEVVKREELIPFSLGKRACLGESLARTEQFIFLSAILQRFKIVPPDGVTEKPLDVRFGFLIRTLPPFEMCAVKRY